MAACGAKTRSGDPCKSPGMKNGRCRQHGGASTGAKIKTGRGAAYLRIFGERFSQLASDPDLLKADAELALFDLLLTERVEALSAGLSGEWIKAIGATAETIRQSALVSPDAKKLREGIERLKELAEQGSQYEAARTEVLTVAKARAEIAIKADAVMARREATMTESQMMVLFVRWIDMTAKEAGVDVARRVGRRFEYEVFDRRDPNIPGVPEGAGVH
ncbi:MAG: HGGxSTG domain-containing protein [bacterium]|nr:HGGxSTG domain-containing protein [bacterium]